MIKRFGHLCQTHAKRLVLLYLLPRLLRNVPGSPSGGSAPSRRASWIYTPHHKPFGKLGG